MAEIVEIGTDEFYVYDSVANVTSYLAGDPQRYAAWAGLSDDAKKRGMVAATRYIDSQPWAGAKTDSDQELQWPRVNVRRADGTAVDSTTVPVEVMTAFYLLSSDIGTNPSVLGQPRGNNIKRAKADTVEIERFRPETGSVLLSTVSGLLTQFLAGWANGLIGGGAIATGTCYPSRFCQTYGVIRSL